MKSVVVVSGGMDSATALYLEVALGREVQAVSFDYGQRHAKELAAAAALCHDLRVPHQVLLVPSLALKGSALTGGAPVPHGHYAEESMKATIVPNRNMVMLSLATAYALSIGATAIVYGAHAGDHAIYPDCRREFVDALAAAIRLADWSPIELRAPFVGMTKAEIVRLGYRLGVPYGATWSCYEGGDEHCGKCGTCVERREAFALAGGSDPTVYRSEAA